MDVRDRSPVELQSILWILDSTYGHCRNVEGYGEGLMPLTMGLLELKGVAQPGTQAGQ